MKLTNLALILTYLTYNKLIEHVEAKKKMFPIKDTNENFRLLFSIIPLTNL